MTGNDEATTEAAQGSTTTRRRQFLEDIDTLAVDLGDESVLRQAWR